MTRRSEVGKHVHPPRPKKPQNFKTPGISYGIADALVIKDWDVFFVIDRDGTVPIKHGHGFGLYYHDCRFLSSYDLRIAGAAPQVLASAVRGGFKGRFELSNHKLALEDGTVVDKEQVTIGWNRMLRGDNLTLNDELVFTNHTLQPIVLPLALEFHADFEDIFAVRGLHEPVQGEHRPPAWDDDVLRFAYAGDDGLYRSVGIHFEPAPTSRDGTCAHFALHLPPGEPLKLFVTLQLAEAPEAYMAHCEPKRTPNLEQVAERFNAQSDAWLAQRTEVQTPSLLLMRIIDRSLLDLHTLRSRVREHEFFAAGIPWYGTLFGRDSLIAAYQTLAFDVGLAEQTLRLLAEYQGHHVNDWRDEEPGKIPHELRVGEFTRLGEVPFGPYYGSVDSTPLFLIMIAEHAAWRGTLDLFRELKGSIEAALGWIDNFGDPHGWGYTTYEKKSEGGLDNQGWKDSGDAIVHADGTLAEPPIALVEVQGYVYMAKLRIADLYARDGQQDKADLLREQARALKERFNRDFWLADRDCYALALAKDKQPCGAIASNMGQALWTGIIDERRAHAVVKRLFADDMYSGWGIRTLSHKNPRYNPVGYHVGTVWPHDNSLIAMGLRCYGFDSEARQVFSGIFEAASHFDQFRMPELFAGFRAEDFGEPVRYPVACHPQAWAAGAIPLLLRNLLGLVPDAFSRRLRVMRPMLPEFVDHLAIERLRLGDACVDLRFERVDGDIRVTPTRVVGDLELEVENADGRRG